MEFARARAPLVKAAYFEELERVYRERYVQDAWLLQAVDTQLSARRSALSLFELAGLASYAPRLPEDAVDFGASLQAGSPPDFRSHLDKVCGRVLSDIGPILREWTYGYLEFQAKAVLMGGLDHLRDQAECLDDDFLMLCLARERCELAVWGLSYTADGHREVARPVLKTLDEAVMQTLAPNLEDAIAPWGARVEQLERAFGAALLDTRWWHLPVAHEWALGDWSQPPQLYLTLKEAA